MPSLEPPVEHWKQIWNWKEYLSTANLTWLLPDLYGSAQLCELHSQIWERAALDSFSEGVALFTTCPSLPPKNSFKTVLCSSFKESICGRVYNTVDHHCYLKQQSLLDHVTSVKMLPGNSDWLHRSRTKRLSNTAVDQTCVWSSWSHPWWNYTDLARARLLQTYQDTTNLFKRPNKYSTQNLTRQILLVNGQDQI